MILSASVATATWRSHGREYVRFRPKLTVLFDIYLSLHVQLVKVPNKMRLTCPRFSLQRATPYHFNSLQSNII
jgi:hypothetical protein